MQHSFLLTALVPLCLAAFGCSAMPDPISPAIDTAELVKSAAFDHSCPARDIRVLARDEKASSPEFVLDVCGKRRTYKRVGMMYFDARDSASR